MLEPRTNHQQPATPHSTSTTWLANLVVGLLLLAGFHLILALGQDMAAPRVEQPELDRSLSALPKYALLTLARGSCAYGLSLLFTVVCGTIAAHHRLAERLLIPLLDVLQAIPVLGFLPGIVLVLLKITPQSNLGLELACILMIFTGQVWNMTFSYYASVRSIPQSLRDVATIQHLSRWQVLRFVELPSAMIGLVWNSMISMAGGWFFLTVTEAFTLEHRQYQLPGIGSYMNSALQHRDWPATIGAILAMLIVILVVDQLVWRPLIVWSQRFRFDEVSGGDQDQSWLLDLLRRSSLRPDRILVSEHLSWLPQSTFGSRLAHPVQSGIQNRTVGYVWSLVLRLAGFLVGLTLLVILVWGSGTLMRFLLALPWRDAERHHDWLTALLALGATTLRTSLAVILAAAWTIPVGVMIGRSPLVARRLETLIQLAASFPAPMLFPLVTQQLLALGVPFTICAVVLLMLSTQWYILFNTIAGAQAIPSDLREVAKVYDFSLLNCWWKLYLPSVFPYVVTGLLTAAGAAWNATIVAEVVAVGTDRQVAFGLGALISQATEDGDYPLLSASVTLTAFTVVILNRLCWKRLYELAQTRFPATS